MFKHLVSKCNYSEFVKKIKNASKEEKFDIYVSTYATIGAAAGACFGGYEGVYEHEENFRFKTFVILPVYTVCGFLGGGVVGIVTAFTWPVSVTYLLYETKFAKKQ